MEYKDTSGIVGKIRGTIMLGAFCLCWGLLQPCAWASGRAEARILAPSAWQGAPQVTTRFGLLQGYADSDETWSWKGVPYARPPVGRFRWRAPVDPEPWMGIRKARSFGGRAAQYTPLLTWIISGSEDCLYLNVWRPMGDHAGLPVYVWIHGGGNSIGASDFVQDYYGHALAHAADMVVVTVNYRIGPFGWFSLPALREGISPEDDSGNYGTLDLLHALKWVQGNIGAFGGDPSNVTIAGESAGAMHVLSLLISPLSRGLFAKAVVESGMTSTRGLQEAEERANAVLQTLLFRDGKTRGLSDAASAAAAMTPERIRAYLRGKSDREILRCYSGGSMGMIDNPAILRDGYVLPRVGFGVWDEENLPNKVPILIGSNKEELKLFLGFAMDWKSDLFAAAARFGSDRWKAAGVDGIARRLSSIHGHPPVFAYLFSWGAPNAEGISPLPGEWGVHLGAFHSLEIPFFMGTDTIEGDFLTPVLFTRENKTGRKALSRSIMDYLGAFARSGNPNRTGSGLPVWSPWSNEPTGPKSIVFDVDGEAPAISMDTRELSLESVDQAMKKELSAELYKQAREYILGFPGGSSGE